MILGKIMKIWGSLKKMRGVFKQMQEDLAPIRGKTRQFIGEQ